MERIDKCDLQRGKHKILTWVRVDPLSPIQELIKTGQHSPL